MAQPNWDPRLKDVLDHDTQEVPMISPAQVTSIKPKLFLNLRLFPQVPLKALMMVSIVTPSLILQKILSMQSKPRTSLT